VVEGVGGGARGTTVPLAVGEVARWRVGEPVQSAGGGVDGWARREAPAASPLQVAFARGAWPSPPLLPRSGGVRPMVTLLPAPGSSTGPPPLYVCLWQRSSAAHPSSPSIAVGVLSPLALVLTATRGNERGQQTDTDPVPLLPQSTAYRCFTSRARSPKCKWMPWPGGGTWCIVEKEHECRFSFV
jgi:hypothetical protein